MPRRLYRLRHRREFRQLFRRGKLIRTQPIDLRLWPNQLGHARIAVVVSTKVNKSAVKRNRIRRKLYGQLEETIDPGPAYDLALIVRQDLYPHDAAQIKTVLNQLFQKAGLKQ